MGKKESSARKTHIEHLYQIPILNLVRYEDVTTNGYSLSGDGRLDRVGLLPKAEQLAFRNGWNVGIL
jgi:hypothetical protein